MNNPDETGERCTLVVADLFAAVNARRKLFKQAPIETRAMASRCTLRFNLDRPRGVDFTAETISIDPADMSILEAMVNDQFDVDFDDELRKLCVKPHRPAVRAVPATPSPAPPPEPDVKVAAVEPQHSGLGSRLKRLFGAN